MGDLTATAALLAAVGLLLVLAGLASPISSRLGVPVLVGFLGLGMLAGSEGIGGIPFDDYALAFRLGTIALVLILFDGGLNTSPAVLRRAALPAGLLATVAVVATAGIVAARRPRPRPLARDGAAGGRRRVVDRRRRHLRGAAQQRRAPARVAPPPRSKWSRASTIRWRSC